MTLIIILLLAAFLRLAGIGIFPGSGALNQDEAFAGYEAWSLMHYGHDTHGYSMPIYLEAWGSGMSALQSYLMMPFIALFGLNAVSIRLPQALFGVLTVYTFYLFLKEIEQEERMALFGGFLLAVTPWHVMMSRWGLDCNFLPGLMLLGCVFLAKASRNPKFFPLSMLFYGISLYSYAAAWMVMPLIVEGSVLYLLCRKKLSARCASFWLGQGILILLALPLFLFLFINFGFMEEIVTPFISIPRLGYFKSDDLHTDPQSVIGGIYRVWHFLTRQYEEGFVDTTEPFGLFYRFTNVLILTGLGVTVKELRDDFEKKQLRILPLIWLVPALAQATLMDMSTNRQNIIYLPLLYFAVPGVFLLCKKLGEGALYAVFLAFLIHVSAFSAYYVTEFNDSFAGQYQAGLSEAAPFAAEQSDGTVHVCSVLYPQILFWNRVNTDEFVETVVYEDPNQNFLRPVSFCGYRFNDLPEDGVFVSGDTWICPADDAYAAALLYGAGASSADFGTMRVYKVP